MTSRDQSNTERSTSPGPRRAGPASGSRFRRLARSPQRWWGTLPLRARLTLWYVLLLAVTTALLGAFLYVQLERRLLAGTDAALHVVAMQALRVLDEEGGRVVFDDDDDYVERTYLVDAPTIDDFSTRLIGMDGDTVFDFTGSWQSVPRPVEFLPGYSSREMPRDVWWRVLTVPVMDDDAEQVGWLEVARSLAPVEEPLEALREQLLWGLALALLLAGAGGFFLAGRALRPIDRITQTAREINAGDLSRRLAYDGPPDELGRLAQTFDAMLERLEGAWAQERRFTADAAHELRTPLSILKGQIEVARSRPRKRAEYERALDELGAQVERLIGLSGDLLLLARLDHRRPDAAWEDLDLSRLLAALADQMRPLFEGAGIRFETALEPDLHVRGRADLLIRLALNLLQNALSYVPADQHVTLAASRHGPLARIAVVDSGPGIAAARLPHLFERFYRADDDRSRAGGGAGLGLAIVREIAALHGGSASVASERGAGSSFTVELPLASH